MTATIPNRIRVEFDPAAHRYLLNGSDAPSVTELLEAEGLSGCEYWKEEHRQRGTAVHKIAHLLGKRPWRGRSVDEIVANSLWEPARTAPILIGYGYAVAQFYLDSGFQPEVVEHPVGSVKMGICGTPDQWGLMPSGARRLVDFKSGEPQMAVHIQTALYEACIYETLGLETDERVAVWLKPNATYKSLPPRPSGGVDLAIGQSAVNLYKWRRRYNML